MTRACKIALLVCMLACIAESLYAQPPFRRRDVSDPALFTAADQLELRQLMMTWIDAAVINQHLTPGIHCNTEFFFTWHRDYVGQLEAWLMTQDKGTKYVPLPKFIPSGGPIPNAFFNNLVAPGSAVEAGFPNLVNQNISGIGSSNFSAHTLPTVCNITAGVRNRACTGPTFGTAADNFAWSVEPQHGSPHVNIGGSMASVPTAPAAAIFFLYHAFIDDIWRHYQCQCQGADSIDLYMKDNPEDIANEPNTTAVSGVLWNSPDIWVRQDADTYIPLTGKYQHEDDINRHQNPEYKAAGNNYVYVRIRNNGCKRVPAGMVNLRVYWSKASSGVWVWPGDWTNTPPFVPPHGDEITVAPIAVPALDPGFQYVAEVPWVVPNPALYPLDPNHFCLLARLESTVDTMTFAEGPDVWTNTRNNNNIAWKNVMVYDLDPFNIAPPPVTHFKKFFLGLVNKKAVTKVKLRFDYAANPGMKVTVDLGKDLYDVWLKGGRRGTGIREMGQNMVEIREPGATLEELQLDPKVNYRPGILAYVQNNPAGGARYAEYGKRYDVTITQYEQAADAADAALERMIGGEVVEVRAERTASRAELVRSHAVTRTSCPQRTDGSITLTMADARDTYTYWWSNGAATRDLRNVPPGEYDVVIRNSAGEIEERSFTVESSSGLQIEMESDLSHCGGANGAVRVAATGGRGAYSYRWYRDGVLLPGETSTSVRNAVAGAYSVDVSDGNECVVQGKMAVRDEWSMLEVFMGTTDASSSTATDGEAQAHAVGMPPYTYRWSNGANSDRIAGLRVGTYWVDVTDMAGCVVRKTFTIRSAESLQGVDRGNTIVANTSIVPNPASGDAELRYRLQIPGMVRVELYDNTGRRVDLLYSGILSVGEQTLRIATKGLASGKYTVMIVAGDISSTVPFVVVH